MSYGNLHSEIDNSPVLSMSKIVQNNISSGVDFPAVTSSTLVLALLSDMLSLSDNSPVSIWTDQSGNNHNFTQTGDARPTKQTEVGYSHVETSSEILQWMLGENWIDMNNLPSFAIFSVTYYQSIVGIKMIISKMTNSSNGSGWEVSQLGSDGIVQDDGGNDWIDKTNVPNDGWHINTMEVLDATSTMNLYINNDDSGQIDNGSGTTVGSHSTTEPVRLFVDQSDILFGIPSQKKLRAILFYQITNLGSWSTDRNIITAWLANRCGITL